MKKRILMCSEASYLSTGFSTYALELLKRLHATGKYELAEMATYGDTSDPSDDRWEDLPWKFFPVMPNAADPQQVAIYNSKPSNQFGSWKFEEVLCDFRPDIVWTYRDWWMDHYVETSPFRPHYHWAHMPTVDAIPQDEWWMATYMDCDAVFAYSDWGLNVLKEQGGGRVRTVAAAPPGADFDTLRPAQDKAAHKAQMSLPADTLVVGTVMRNQQRKLYPDLIASFAEYLRRAPEDLARRTYLYLHCCYPDLGWDIPKLVKEAGVGHRTLFTYFCNGCGTAFPSFYADAIAHCRSCGQMRAKLPNSSRGVSRAVLSDVLNFFDVYVQYANSEGFGMPQVEAAACGVPVMAVDYSAMSDVVRKLGGVPLKVKALCREATTGCFRAVPDNDDLVDQLVRFFRLPASVRTARGRQARLAATKHYNYDRTAEVWERHFDSVTPRGTWGSPPRTHTNPGPIPQGLTHEEWVRWGITHVAGRPDLAESHMALRMTRDLTWGAVLGNLPRSVFNEMSLLGTDFQASNYTREDAERELLEMCERRNYWESRRAEGGGG